MLNRVYLNVCKPEVYGEPGGISTECVAGFLAGSKRDCPFNAFHELKTTESMALLLEIGRGSKHSR